MLNPFRSTETKKEGVGSHPAPVATVRRVASVAVSLS